MCHPESARVEMRQCGVFCVYEFVRSWAVVWKFLIFFLVRSILVAFPQTCMRVSDLYFLLVLWVIFIFPNFSQLRMMNTRTWLKISFRSVVPKRARIFTLTTSAHFSVWFFPGRHRVLAVMRSVFSVLWVWRERRPSLWELWKLEI